MPGPSAEFERLVDEFGHAERTYTQSGTAENEDRVVAAHAALCAHEAALRAEIERLKLAQSNAEGYVKACIDMRYQRDAAEDRAEKAEAEIERLKAEVEAAVLNRNYYAEQRKKAEAELARLKAAQVPERRVLHAPTPDDLVRVIYKAEGWERVEGESRVVRCRKLYDISSDGRRYTAIPRTLLASEAPAAGEALRKVSQRVVMLVNDHIQTGFVVPTWLRDGLRDLWNAAALSTAPAPETPSPDYIRGRRDAFAEAISTAKLALEDCEQWETALLDYIAGLKAEIERLTKAGKPV